MPRPKNTTPKVRLNLELSKKTRDKLEALKELMDAESLTEVVRRSLDCYEAIIMLKTEGVKLVI